MFGLSADQAEASVTIRSRAGFVSEGKDLYDYMTVGEMLAFTASFYPRWRSDLETALPQRPSSCRSERSIKTLSLGMRSKLALILALCRGAELLVLDEPTSGLDPAAIEQVLQAVVAHAASDGVTVFFSSHQIAEVEQIADRVVIIDRGQAVVDGALDDLRERYRRVHCVFDGEAPERRCSVAGVVRVTAPGRELAVLRAGGATAVIAEGARARRRRGRDAAGVAEGHLSRERQRRGVNHVVAQSWLETRSRFAIGLALLLVMAAGAVFGYPAASRLIAAGWRSIDPNGPLGRVIADAIAVQRDFRGFVWWEWHRQNLTQTWTLFAVLLGSGGLLSRGAWQRCAVHDVAAGVAQSAARRARGDRPGANCWCSPSSRRCSSSCCRRRLASATA